MIPLRGDMFFFFFSATCDSHFALVTVGEKEFVFHESGLYPLPLMPWMPEYDSKISAACRYMRVLGEFIAKALLDDQLVNIPLSIPFLKVMLGYPLSVKDLQLIRPWHGKFIARTAKDLRKLFSEKSQVVSVPKVEIRVINFPFVEDRESDV